jgi:hypothetical protein
MLNDDNRRAVNDLKSFNSISIPCFPYGVIHSGSYHKASTAGRRTDASADPALLARIETLERFMAAIGAAAIGA